MDVDYKALNSFRTANMMALSAAKGNEVIKTYSRGFLSQYSNSQNISTLPATKIPCFLVDDALSPMYKNNLFPLDRLFFL